MDKEKSAERADFGRFAEQVSADYLMKEGYTIRETNWSPSHSHLEVDIIAQKDDTIVFAEVKARGLAWDADPASAVDIKKQRNLFRAAEMYLSQEPFDYYYRFDIIAVKGNRDNYSIEHYPDAFLPDVRTY